MRRFVAVLTVVMIILGACESRPGGGESEPPDAESDTVDLGAGDRESVERDPPEGDGADPNTAPGLGISLSELIERGQYRAPGEERLVVLDRLNEPARVTTETQENRHVRGQVDTLRTLHYDGVSVTVYHVSGGRELLHSLTIRSDDIASPEGVRLGMERAEVVRLLGESDENRDGALVYLQDGPMPRRFRVHLDGERVGRMEWIFPID